MLGSRLYWAGELSVSEWGRPEYIKALYIMTTLCTFIYMVGAIVPVVAIPLLKRYSSLFDFNSIKYFFIIKLTEKLRLNSPSCKNIVHYQEFFRTGNKHDSKVN